MDVLFEQNVVQNTGLAAEVLFVVVREFYDKKSQTEGLPFPLMFLVLPLAFHKATVDAIKSKTSPGILFKVIRDNGEITLGVQQRMESMYRKTLDAFSIAVDSGLLAYDGEVTQVIPQRKSLPASCAHSTTAIVDIIKAAKRIGIAFAEHSVEELSQMLKVVF